MNDLLESMAEHHAERLAIMQESGVIDPVAAAADDLHRCEIAADRLRDDVRAAWKQRRIDEAGQA